MAQFGKGAARRGKPSYFMSVLGVTLVLFLLGLVGWLLINANKISDYFRENVEVRVHLKGNLTAKDSLALVQYIAAKPYVKSYTFVNKDMAKEIFLKDGNKSFDEILDYNPLPNSINFHLKKEYVHVDTLEKIRTEIEQTQQVFVSDVAYPKDLVTNLNKNLKNISLVILVVAIILAIVVIILIDNTIRLAMFSNRFLIKTMQMVGATRWFIAKPLNIRAIINGALSGVIAMILVYLLMLAVETVVPELKAIRDNSVLVILFISLVILGIFITLFSSHRSVIKYLRMKLDELY
ncbi:MAG TPA: permease-like cell division protein FtsX [Flavisolibacter sp.]|jgi:cell division transport system permease protein